MKLKVGFILESIYRFLTDAIFRRTFYSSFPKHADILALTEPMSWIPLVIARTSLFQYSSLGLTRFEVFDKKSAPDSKQKNMHKFIFRKIIKCTEKCVLTRCTKC